MLYVIRLRQQSTSMLNFNITTCRNAARNHGQMTGSNHADAARVLRPLSRLRGRDGVGERLAPVFVAAPTLALPRKRERVRKTPME